MNDFEKLYSIDNLYKAHTVARRNKRDTREVIDFELDLSSNLCEISNSIKNKKYKLSGYYDFMVYDPKERKIHALHYKDRVVQHCLCDEILAPIIDKKLIYDNSACRIGRGNHFALKRVCKFFTDFYKHYGDNGYILRCDIKKYFDNIDHIILKQKLNKIIEDKDVLEFLYQIIDSYEKSPGKGLPLGNQTSQWFALYYLDEMDRFVKEGMQVKYYSRYMDDCVLIHKDKEYLKNCKEQMERIINNNLKLEFNLKTQIFPIKNGVDYLGFHIYLTPTGKVIRKVKQQTKNKFKRKMKYIKTNIDSGKMSVNDANQIINSYNAHLSFGHTYKLQQKYHKQRKECL